MPTREAVTDCDHFSFWLGHIDPRMAQVLVESGVKWHKLSDHYFVACGLRIEDGP